MIEPGVGRPIRVLVVDDSAFMRHAVGRILSEAGMEVVGTAGDGEAGLAAVVRLQPDVVTLDLEMPRLDGLGMLRRLMREAPARVVVLSSLTTEGAAITMEALELGAIEVVAKPGGALTIDIGRVAAELTSKVRAAASVSSAAFLAHRQRAVARATQEETRPPRAAAPGRPDPATGPAAAHRPAHRLVVIAASTGGPAALQRVVAGLPSPLGSGVLVVQHMPAGFTAALAQRLAVAGPLPCREAAAGDPIAEDEILVAPGGLHLLTSLSGRVELAPLPPVNGVRPAADVTLQAVAPVWRENLLAVVLTGMGQDGAAGGQTVKAHGGSVFAQDEGTAVVYGMPAAVAPFADRILPLEAIPEAIAHWVERRAAAGSSLPGPGWPASAPAGPP
jgi:two-component system chemotaxis response regulator CheB